MTTGRKGKAREGSNGAESEGQGWARCPSKSKGKSKRSGKSKSEGKGGSKRQSEAEGTGPGSRSPEAPCSTPRRAEGSATLGLRPHSKRRRSHCGRTPEGEADRRGGGALLPQGVQGSGERCHSVPRGRSGDFEAASYGHHRRGATEVAEWNSRIGAPLDTLWRGVQPRGDSRGPHPRCEDPEEKERRGRGALGGQPGKSVPPGEGGRAIVPESSSEGARPEESSRCCSGGRESRKEKEKGERKGEEKEEAKKGEGGSQEEEYVERKFLIGEASPGWNSSKGGVTEDCEKPVPGNGLGSGRTGPTEGGAPGQTLCAQKRKAKFFRLRLIQRELKRRKTGGRGGHRLPARVRGIAEAFPGVLAHQALNQMKSNLMQHLGEDDKGGACQPVAVQYYRQVLQRKAGGATARELLSLCAAADLLVRGRPAQALDLILQRVKSAESTLGGTHWTVSQKLEVLPAEQATITATSELKEAQKVAQEEAKMRWLATSPDTRFSPSQKGGGKGKPGKGGDGKKGGKNQNSKGDGKRKEEGAGKGT